MKMKFYNYVKIQKQNFKKILLIKYPKISRKRTQKNLISSSENFEELDFENLNINNNKKNNNEEFMEDTFYKNYDSNNLVNTKKIINRIMSKEFIQKQFSISFMLILNKIYVKFYEK